MISNTKTKTTAVIVIGAGASGLAAAQALCARGIPVRILDQATRPGDAWYHRHPQLRINTHRHLSALPGLAIPRSAGAYPTRDSIIRYRDDYAARLDAPIDYGHRLRASTRTKTAGQSRRTPAFTVLAMSSSPPASSGLWFTGMRPRLTGFFHLATNCALESAGAIESGMRRKETALSGRAGGVATSRSAA